MRWQGNPEEFSAWACRPDVKAGSVLHDSLSSIPLDIAQAVAQILEADLERERSAHGFAPSRLIPGVSLEPQILSARDMRLWDRTNRPG